MCVFAIWVELTHDMPVQSLHYGAAQMFGRIGSDHQPKADGGLVSLLALWHYPAFVGPSGNRVALGDGNTLVPGVSGPWAVWSEAR